MHAKKCVVMYAFSILLLVEFGDDGSSLSSFFAITWRFSVVA